MAAPPWGGTDTACSPGRDSPIRPISPRTASTAPSAAVSSSAIGPSPAARLRSEPDLQVGRVPSQPRYQGELVGELIAPGQRRRQAARDGQVVVPVPLRAGGQVVGLPPRRPVLPDHLEQPVPGLAAEDVGPQHALTGNGLPALAGACFLPSAGAGLPGIGVKKLLTGGRAVAPAMLAGVSSVVFPVVLALAPVADPPSQHPCWAEMRRWKSRIVLIRLAPAMQARMNCA